MTGFRVRVPASTANLGPGFDALGMALGLYDLVEVSPMDTGLVVEVIDAGAGDVSGLPTDETHLVVRAVHRACLHLGVRPSGLHLRCHNTIPHARGLGSSAAAVVAGIAAGYALAGKDIDAAALGLAAEFEGHADNAAASLLGGIVLAWHDENAAQAWRAVRMDPHPGIRPLVAVPEQRSSTEATRGLLPKRIPHADAAFSAGRAALGLHALTRDPGLLLPGTEDRLHQGYRAPAYPATTRLIADLRERGIAATVSGAGPTVLVLTTDGTLPADVDSTGFSVSELPIDLSGVRVTTP
ncbi:MAG: homoserine kinase [Haloechinothrix sp.]